MSTENDTVPVIEMINDEEPMVSRWSRKKIALVAGGAVGFLMIPLLLRSPKSMPARSERQQPRPKAITTEEQRLKFIESTAPVSSDAVNDALDPHHDDMTVFGALRSATYMNASGGRPGSRRGGNGGNEIIVWRRSGISTGETGGLGILTGTIISDVTLLNRIVSYNVESPVRAELEKSFDLDGRTILPKGSIFLGTAGVQRSIDRIHVKFERIITPDGKEIAFKGRALMEDGSQGIVGAVDLQKDVSLAAGAGSALSTTARAAARASAGMGFGAQLGANLADETLRDTQSDLNDARRVDRVITVSEFTPIAVYVDESI